MPPLCWIFKINQCNELLRSYLLKPKNKNTKFFYSIFSHPISRCLKFNNIIQYLESIPNGGTILDYGSGDRPYEDILLTIFEKYISADYPVTNQHHNLKPDIEIKLDQPIDIMDNSVNCVVLTEVLEHLYNPLGVLKDLNRVLKPGGFLIGTVPFVMSEHEQPYDYHRYTCFCLDKMFNQANFKIIKLDYVGDLIGVFLRVWEMLVAVPLKIFRKVKLNWLAIILGTVLRAPVIIYYYLLKARLNPQRIQYLKCFPLGFTFILEKPK